MEAGKDAIVALITRAWASDIGSIEAVSDVASGAPGVGNCLGPGPWSILTPVTHAVQDGSASSVQSLGHGVVAVESGLWVASLAFVVAVVVPE